MELENIDTVKSVKDLNLLIKYMCKQTDDEVKEDVLNAILTSKNYNVHKELDLLPIVSNIFSFNDINRLKDDVKERITELNYRRKNNDN